MLYRQMGGADEKGGVFEMAGRWTDGQDEISSDDGDFVPTLMSIIQQKGGLVCI